MVLAVAGSVVIGDFDIMGVSVFPAEADPPLLVDADAELAVAISLQRFEPVGRWNPQVVDVDGLADHGELDEGALLDVRGESSGTLFIPDFPRFLVGEAYQHQVKIDYLRFASILIFGDAQGYGQKAG
jgi:hypothetical protein